MANKTIPQLPEQTGKTDNDLLVIVDSGETTTSKIKLSTLLSGVGGSSFFSADTDNNVLQIDRGHSFISGDSSNTMLYNFILGGSGNTMNNQTNTNHTAERNVMIGGYNNIFRPGSNNSTTRNAAIIGGENHIFGRESDNSILIGGQGNAVSYGYRSVIAGGEGNLFSQQNNFLGGGKNNSVLNNHSGIIGGESHYLFSSYGFMGGGYDNTINAYNLRGNGIIGGETNTISGVAKAFIGGGTNNTLSGNNGYIIAGSNNSVAASNGGIIGSNSSTISNGNDSSTNIFGGTSNEMINNGGLGTFIVGGLENKIRNFDGTTNADERRVLGGIIGGRNNKISGDTSSINGSHAVPIILGGLENNMSGSTGNGTFYSSIISSSGSTIVNSTLSSHINSKGSTISGGDNIVMLGCSGRTGTNSYTTYVETLEAFTHVVLNDYSNLNFADDAAAATGGVPLGGVYHTSGALKVRIT